MFTLLAQFIGQELDSLVQHGSDHPWANGESDDSSPRILWAAEGSRGEKYVLVDEHPRKLLIVRSAFDSSEVPGNVEIARRLEELGIMEETSRRARCALPPEISDEFPRVLVERANSGNSGRQLSLFVSRPRQISARAN